MRDIVSSLGRLSLVELCRRLQLAGWESLHAAEAAGKGVLALLCPPGEPELAAWALDLYPGPLYRAFHTPHPAAPRRAEGKPPLVEDEERALALLAGGARLALSWVSPEIDIPTLACRLAWASGAPLLPVQGHPFRDARSGNRWRVRGPLAVRVEVHPPLWPREEASAEDLAQALVARVETLR